jgi:hypothetical protein
MIGRQGRLVATVVSGLLVLGVLGACGGSDDNSSDTTTTTAPTTTLTEAQKKDAITKVFTDFFDGKNPDLNAKAQKLDDPDKYMALYNKFATDPVTGPQLAGTSITVTNVDLKPDGTAEVTYTLNLNGTPALENQLGTAVQVDGEWRVAGSTFCDLAALGNPAAAQDPACA